MYLVSKEARAELLKDENEVGLKDSQALVHVRRFEVILRGPLRHDKGSRTADVDLSQVLSTIAPRSTRLTTETASEMLAES